MPNRLSKIGSELFIVDNSDADWKGLRYLHDWCGLSKAIDIATGYFEIGALLGLKDEWQKVDAIRILMGDEVSRRTHAAFAEGLKNIKNRLDASLEDEKEKNDFLLGVPAGRLEEECLAQLMAELDSLECAFCVRWSALRGTLPPALTAS